MEPVLLFPIDPNIFLQQIREIIKSEMGEMQKHLIGKIEEEDDTIKLNEAVKITGYKPKSIYDMVYKKAIPHLKVGKGALRFSRKELKDWMNAGRPSIYKDAIENMATNYIVNGKS